MSPALAERVYAPGPAHRVAGSCAVRDTHGLLPGGAFCPVGDTANDVPSTQTVFRRESLRCRISHGAWRDVPSPRAAPHGERSRRNRNRDPRGARRSSSACATAAGAARHVETCPLHRRGSHDDDVRGDERLSSAIKVARAVDAYGCPSRRGTRPTPRCRRGSGVRGRRAVVQLVAVTVPLRALHGEHLVATHRVTDETPQGAPHRRSLARSP